MRMKNFTLTLVALFCSMATFAKEYTSPLSVTVNGLTYKQVCKINVEEGSDGLYTLSLNNFCLEIDGMKTGVGNIVMDNLEPLNVKDGMLLLANRDIEITEGDDPDVEFWMGPFLGAVPVDLRAYFDDDLYVLINIDMTETLGQVIKVVVGEKEYQLPNGGFEMFRTEGEGSTEVQEPIGWHSFGSCTGTFAPAAKQQLHTFPTCDGVEGWCVSVKSTSIAGVIANGTITTGQMKAGSMIADNKGNNAFLDMSNTETDSNGDPFYAKLDGRPDSLAMWVYFKQATANSKFPYATVSAIITDGTYYQDPEDKTYPNVLAKAQNATIAETGGWQRISIPFEYVDKNVDGKAILVTISTNATPGKGSDGDEIRVDDIELVYNAVPNAIKVKDQEVATDLFVYNEEKEAYEYTVSVEGEVTANDIKALSPNNTVSAHVSVEDTDDGLVAKVVTFSEDFASSAAYVLNIAVLDGIRQTEVAPKTVSTYNLSGQQVKEMRHGEVYIQRQADGKVVKVAK